MKKVVVIGGGFAGAYCARRLETKFDLTLIDSKDYYEFTPAVLRTIVEPWHARRIEVEHRRYLKKAKIVKSMVTKVTPNSAFVGDKEYSFDYLIIAAGSSYTTPIKEDNLVVSSRAAELKEYAERLREAERVLVIGGGIVGVELAAEIITHFPSKKVTILHSGQKLIDRNPPRAIEYTTNWLTKRCVEIIYGERASGTKDGLYETDKGRKMKVDLAFWCTGITPNGNLVGDSLSAALGKNHSINVNPYMQVMGCSHIFAAGDLTGIREEKTAQNAEKQAGVVVENIIRLEAGKDLVSYESKPRVMIISLGKWDGFLTYKNFVVTGLIPGLLKNVVEWKTMVHYRS